MFHKNLSKVMATLTLATVAVNVWLYSVWFQTSVTIDNKNAFPVGCVSPASVAVLWGGWGCLPRGLYTPLESEADTLPAHCMLGYTPREQNHRQV